MEGKGAYNRYAKLPAGGAALALPLPEKAIAAIELGADDQPVVIADYGSSQGKNSLAPHEKASSLSSAEVGRLWEEPTEETGPKPGSVGILAL